jgi:hypothetical protein
MKDVLRLAALNHILKWEVTFTQTLLTRHLRVTEVQVLHAHGKMPLRKVTCEKEHRATRQEKRRKRGEGEE